MEETRLTHAKEAISHGVQRLRDLLATGSTKGVQQFHRGAARVRVWGMAGVDVVCNRAKRGVACLRRHPTGLKVLAGIALVVALVVLVLLALWKIPLWQVADPTLSVKERIELQDKARGTLAQSIGTLAQIIGGMALLVGLFLTWRNVAAAWRAVQVNEEGQITERFTRAIDQLGSDKLAIRLGGIYALERIARDSPKDHRPIMEVLTAYVREHAPWKDTPQPQGGTPPESEEPAPESHIQLEPPQPLPTPAADIQAILTVLGRRSRWYGQGEDQPLDLHKTNLEGASLVGAHLEHASLAEAHLEGAILVGARLEGAILVGAHLEGAILMGARLEGAILVGAHLEGAILVGAHLEHASLAEAHLEGASLAEAHLEGASLAEAHLEGAILVGATGITKEQLASAITDKTTRLPGYLTTDEKHGNNPTASGEAS